MNLLNEDQFINMEYREFYEKNKVILANTPYIYIYIMYIYKRYINKNIT